MGARFVCVLLTVIVFVLPMDAQAPAEDSHICVEPFSLPKTIVVTRKCRRGSNQICTKISKQYVIEMRPSCCEGWISSTTENKCIPDCRRGCSGGTCIAPDTCSCDPPLILKNNNSCVEPQCNPSCVNANCMDDDKCICIVGYTRHNATHCTPICQDGYIIDQLALKCKPKCDKCINGTCTAPNTCTCDEGYILENSTCVPYCNHTCENGRCVAPNTCECNVGYSVDRLDNSVCHPICENACYNATCVEPDRCACLSGYEPIDSWACKPKCDDCNNGECVAPNQCVCLNGYFKTDGVNCTPTCSKPCLNGHCSAPDTCSCDTGYELESDDKFECRPVCNDICVNGNCVAPDNCTCNSGFEKLNDTVCIPICASCENGVCTAPGNCECNEGFETFDGKCKPICSSPCINGYCETPEKCACNEGYVQDGSQAICYKPCTGECNNGKCNIDGECLCSSEYKLFNDSCIIPDNCESCNVSCVLDECQCEDGRPCYPPIDMPMEAASTSLAGLQITWVLGGCLGILLVTIVIVVIGYIWRKRKEYGEKPNDNGNTYPSVLYTVPNTLIQNDYGKNRDDSVHENEDEDSADAVSVHYMEAGGDANEKIAL